MSWLIDGQQRVLTLDKIMSGIDVMFNPDGSDGGEFQLANAATRNAPRQW